MTRRPQAPIDVIIAGENFTYTYPKDTGKLDIVYQVEISTDLKTWIPIADTLVSTEGAIEMRQVSIPLNSSQQFLRLTVTQ